MRIMQESKMKNCRARRMSSLRRDLFTAMLPILLGVEILASVVYLPIALRGNADFLQFYTGGYMLRAGYGHRLYDYELQQQISHSPLPAVHPAYEYLVFLPLSFVKYRTAYWIWLAVNFGLLAAGLRLMRREFDGPRWLLVAIGLAFVPVWVTFAQGQDSLLLLDLLLLAHYSRDDFRAGLWLGAGAFKFHIVAPIALIYLCWRKSRFLGGAFLTAAGSAILSLALVGVHESLHYISTATSRAATQLHPGAMPNLYGFTTAVIGKSWTSVSVAIFGAVAALLWARRQEPSLATAITIVPLIAFYFMGHDLTILLLPIVTSAMWIPWIGAAAILVPGHAYLAVLTLLGIFWRTRRIGIRTPGDTSTESIERYVSK